MIGLAVADIGKRFDWRVGLFVSTGIQILGVFSQSSRLVLTSGGWYVT